MLTTIGKRRSQVLLSALLPTICLILSVSTAFGQGETRRVHATIFAGAGWARWPSSSGLLGGSIPGENEFSPTGGAEVTLSHVGFRFDLTQMNRRVNFMVGNQLLETKPGETLASGDGVFYILTSEPVRPFMFIGYTRAWQPNIPTSTSGGNLGFGADIRLTPHVMLRPELRGYLLDILNSGPIVTSVSIGYRW